MNVPVWAEAISTTAVKCKTCDVTYTEPYPFTEFYAKGTKSRVKMVGGIPKTCTVCRQRRKEEKRKALPLNPVLIAAVRKHAEECYNEDGWDFIVESYEDEELWEVIAGAKTDAAAIKRAASVAALHKEREDDVRSTIW